MFISNIKLLFIYLRVIFGLLILSSCGGIVSSGSSTVETNVIGWSHISNINSVNISSYTLYGTCMPGGGDVTLEVGLPSILTQSLTCINGMFSQIMNLSSIGLADGAVQLSAFQNDISTSAITSVLVDTSTPLAPVIINPTNNFSTRSRNIIVDGSCESGTVLNFSGGITGGIINSDCIGNSFSLNLNLSAGIGAKVIAASQTDLSGNISPSTFVSVNYDDTAPPAPVITAPINGASFNQVAQTVSGFCETEATVTLNGGFLESPTIFTCMAGSYSQDINLTSSDGTKSLNISQVDLAGNISVTTSVNIILDQTIPLAPSFISPSEGQNINQTNQIVSGACETNAVISITGDIIGGSVTAVCSASSFAVATMIISGDGIKSLNATQTDPASNFSPISSVSFNLDQTLPLAPTITAPVNNLNTNNLSQTISGACENNATVDIAGNIVGSPVSVICAANFYSRSVTLVSGAGTKTVSVTQTDLSANTSAATSIVINLDQTAPLRPTITAPPNLAVLNTNTQSVTGACETGANVTLTGDFTGGALSFVCVGSGYSEPISLIAGDGTKNLSILQVDAAGNTSLATTIDVILDQNIPIAPTIVSPTNGSTTNSLNHTFNGACETDATVSISGNIVGGPISVTCTSSSYAGSVTLVTGDGVKNISVTQIDLAANISPAAALSLNLDQTTPIAPSVSAPTSGLNTSEASQTFTGVCETSATVSISGDILSSPLELTCAGSSYSQIVNLASGDGLKTINLTQTDLALNISSATTVTLNLDQGIPLAPTVNSPIDGAYINTSSQVISGACETDSTLSISGDIVGGPISFLCVANSYSQAVTLQGSDGAKSISVIQTDLALNVSPVTQVNVNLDQSVPSAPTISSPADGLNTNTLIQTVTGVCETGATLNILGDIVGSPVNTLCASSTYSTDVTLNFGDGAKNINVTQIDAATNNSPAIAISVNLDQTAPFAPSIASPTNGLNTSNETQTVSGNCETNSTLTISGDILGSSVDLVCAASAYSQTVTLTLSDGVKNLSVTQTDLASNISAASAIIVNLDQSAPLAPTIFNPTDGLNTKFLSQTISGACETNLTVNISGNILGSPVNIVCSANAYSQSVTLSSGDGIKNISATQTDLASNISLATSVAVNLDQTLPSAPTITSPVDDLNTNDPSQTMIGACETDANVTVSGNFTGSPLNLVCVSSAYSQTLTLTSGDGVKNLSVIQTDQSGNASAATAIDINFDQTSPLRPTVITPVDGLNTNDTSQIFSGECETGATVSLSGDLVGGPVSSLCAANSYSLLSTLKPGDGAKTINVTQTDLASNISLITSLIINLDQAAPAGPTILSPPDGLSTNQTSQTLNGACETNLTVNVMGDILGSPLAVSCASGSYALAVTLTSGDGVKNLNLTQTDLAGNVSVASTLTINLDQTAPAAAVISSPISGSAINSETPNIVGTCEANSQLTFAGSIMAGPVISTCDSGGNFDVPVNFSSSDGTKTLTLLQTDPSGNQSAQATITIVLDTTVPAAPVIFSPLNNSFTNQNTETVSGECESGTTVSINGNLVGAPVTTSCVSSTFSQAISYVAGDGVKNLSLSQSDLAGNVSAISAVSVTLDTAAPAAVGIASPSEGEFVNSITLTLNGTCEDLAKISLTGDLTGSPVRFSCNGSVLIVNVSLTAGEGLKTVNAIQTDLAGNVSASTTRTVNLDLTAPSAPTITSPLNGTFTNTRNQTASGVCETGSTVFIAGNIVSSGVSLICAGGTYSQAVVLTPGDSSKVVTARQTDMAGNISATTNINLTLDQVASAAPSIASPTDNLATSNPAQTISGICATGDTVQGSGDFTGSPFSISCSGGSYSQTVNLSAPDGSKLVSVTQTDPANNTSAAVAITIFLDTTRPPSPTITSPMTGVSSNQITQSIIGNCENGSSINITGDINPSPVLASCLASNYMIDIDLSVGSGLKSVTAMQTDGVGNTSLASTITINLDQTPSAAPTVLSPADGLITNQISQTLSGSCETGDTVNVISSAMTGSPYSVICASSSYSVSVNLTALNELKSYSVNQTDSAGNISTNVTRSINLDTSDPSPPVFSSPIDGAYINAEVQSILGTCEADATLSLSGDIIGGPLSITCSSGSTFSQSVNLSPTDGPKNLSLFQTDLAMNTSTPTVYTLNLDTVAPVVTISSSESSPTISNPIIYSVSLNESVQSFDPNDLSITNGSIVTSSGGPLVYSVTINPSSAGDVSVQLPSNQVQDLAGNFNVASNITTVEYLPPPANAFVTSWSIPADNTNVTLPLAAGFSYNFTIDWGDSTPISTVTSFNDPDGVHTYALAGSYIVTMTGSLDAFGTAILPNPCYISSVYQIGYMGWLEMQNMFKDCTLLTTIQANGDEFSTVTRMDGMFSGSTLANPEVSLWDVSSVTSFYQMFFNATSVTPNTSSWDVSSAIDMEAMFMGATSANPDTSNWDTSSLVNAPQIFDGASSANPDTTTWDLALVGDLTDIFYNSGISNANYTNFLIMADSTSVQTAISVGSVPAQFQPAASSSRANLTSTKSWTIMDLGAE